MKLLNFALLVSVTHASLTWFSYTCPTSFSTISSFDATSYLGRWYEVSSDSWNIFQLNGQCITATYSSMDDGDVKVVNRGWFWWFFFSYYSIEGKARALSNGNGELAVDFNIFNDDRLSGASNYNILSTDYTSYALVYACSVGALGIDQYVWILSRSTTMSDSTLTALKSVLSAQVPDYDQSLLGTTTQDGTCTYE